MLRLFVKILSWVSLVGLVVPAILYLMGRMELDQVKYVMLIMTIIWFILASLWMWKNDVKAQENKS
jgi:uncharacterized membrane protein